MTDSQRIFVDGYALIVFRQSDRSAMIYIEEAIAAGLPFFQLDMLEGLFKRLSFYCDNSTNLDIFVRQVNRGEIRIVAYLYNNYQNFDFCASFDDTFIALHSALTKLFDLAINNQERRSINLVSPLPLSGNLEKIGLAVDKIFPNDRD